MKKLLNWILLIGFGVSIILAFGFDNYEHDQYFSNYIPIICFTIVLMAYLILSYLQDRQESENRFQKEMKELESKQKADWEETQNKLHQQNSENAETKRLKEENDDLKQRIAKEKADYSNKLALSVASILDEKADIEKLQKRLEEIRKIIDNIK